jgi:hypothetical protein
VARRRFVTGFVVTGPMAALVFVWRSFSRMRIGSAST